MDLEPHLIKKQSSDLDFPFINKETDQPFSDDDDPYSFSSTSTSFIGLAIVFVMLLIPFLAVINERPKTKESILPTSINHNGPKSSSALSFAWIRQSSC